MKLILTITLSKSLFSFISQKKLSLLRVKAEENLHPVVLLKISLSHLNFVHQTWKVQDFK